MNYVYIARDNNSITFESPNSYLSTMRFKRSVSTKNLNQVTLKNIRQEIIVTDNGDFRGPCADPCDGFSEALSIRITISGSTGAWDTRLQTLLDAGYAAAVEQWSRLKSGNLPVPASVIDTSPTVEITHS